MFVRKKVNRSGTISVVVVNKLHGKFTEVRNFGIAKSESEADKLFQEAQLWLRTHDGQQEFDFDDRRGKELEETIRVVENMDSVLINGTQLLLNKVYDNIGFNRIPDEILRHLVIARVSQPQSKLATVNYLKSYYDEDVDLNHIYRYMDKLYNTQMEHAQQISVEHTRKTFGGKINVVLNNFEKTKKGSKAKAENSHLSGERSNSFTSYGKYDTFRASNRQTTERKHP